MIFNGIRHFVNLLIIFVFVFYKCVFLNVFHDFYDFSCCQDVQAWFSETEIIVNIFFSPHQDVDGSNDVNFVNDDSNNNNNSSNNNNNNNNKNNNGGNNPYDFNNDDDHNNNSSSNNTSNTTNNNTNNTNNNNNNNGFDGVNGFSASEPSVHWGGRFSVPLSRYED